VTKLIVSGDQREESSKQHTTRFKPPGHQPSRLWQGVVCLPGAGVLSQGGLRDPRPASTPTSREV